MITHMNTPDVRSNLTRFVRVAGALWLLYLLIIATFDMLMLPNNLFLPLLRYYYLVNFGVAVCFIAFALWKLAQRRLDRLFLPFMIFICLVPPMINNVLVVPFLPRGPTVMVEGIALRTAPITAIALILLVSEYPFKVTAMVFLGTAVIRAIYLLLQIGPNLPAFYPSFLIALIYPASYLTIGYVMTRLIRQLREQQHALHESNRQLKHYASTLEQLTISRERNRIARELHDVLAHTLSGLSVQLESVKAYWEVDPKASLSMVEKSLEATRRGLEETRRALKALRASPLEDLGLALAIAHMAQDTATRGNLRLDLALPATLHPLPFDVEQGIYRIVQEALTNVLHHADAKCLQVSLRQETDHLTLDIRDDGIGFERNKKKDSGHFGLVGMRERATLIGGVLSIDSQPGRGTHVQLSL
jgi:signal transduction histidine kinase